MEHIIIDIESLKKTYKDDPLPLHIWFIAYDCKRKRDIYLLYTNKLDLYNKCIYIPLLVFSTLTSIVSCSQFNNVFDVISLIVAISSLLTTILNGLQRFLLLSSRAEKSKYIAKSYGKLATKIENMMILFESKAIKIEQENFIKFIEDIQRDNELLSQEVEDFPKELLKHKFDIQKKYKINDLRNEVIYDEHL